MKKFTAEEIRTDKDGNIFLLGRKGILRIKRVNDSYSAADFAGYAPDKDIHKVYIDEVPCHPNRLMGGIAF